MLGPTYRTRRTAIEIGLLIIVVSIATTALLTRLRRIRRTRLESPEVRYRRDIQGLRPRARALSANASTEELWSAGATSDSKHSRAKKAGATLTAGLIGCGGCGGCGCGG
jgi:type II secretory pathway pseudopilin PulG